MPKSVCGPIRNWFSSGSPAIASGGYQLMFMVCVGVAGVPGEEVFGELQGFGAQHQQLVGQRAHLGQVGRDRAAAGAGTSAG